MKTNYMLEYNKVFDKIVNAFWTRFYKEAFDEEFNNNDINIIDYKWLKHMVEISDEYYSLEDMIFTLEYNIPIKILRDHYSESLDAHMNWENFKYNLFNYFLIKDEENYKKWFIV